MKKVFIIINALLGVLDVCLILMKLSIDSQNLWNWGWTIASMQMVYLVLSLRVVGPTELGGVLFFGKPIRSVSSGLVLVPFLICSLRKDTALVIQMQIPGEPEKIFRQKEGESEAVPEGMVLPVRILTGSAKIAKDRHSTHYPLVDGDPLNDTMTLEVSAIARGAIEDYILFLRTIGDLDKAKQQIRDTLEILLNSEFVTRTPALIRLHWDEINQKFQTAVDKLVRSWGMRMDEGTKMVSIDPTHTINKSLRDRLDARIKKETAITTAQGTADAERLTGKGKADARQSWLEAEAAGKTKLAEVAKSEEGKYALAIEAAQKMAEASKHTILQSGGDGGLLGLAAGAAEALKKLTSRDAEPPTKPT
jgi:regulator of protease activity HflC (stomatin/prohibitin superfamily)